MAEEANKTADAYSAQTNNAQADAQDKKDEQADKDTKPTITAAEAQRLVAQAKADERAALAAEQKKKDDQAEAERLKEQGKFKELHEKAVNERDEKAKENESLKLQLKRHDVRDAIREYLLSDHPDYLASDKYILPVVEFDLNTAPEDITKRVKVATDQFVNDHRKTAQHGTPTPPPREKITAGVSPGALTGANGEPQVELPYSRSAY